MRRRFGRRRRTEETSRALDVGRELARAVEAGVVEGEVEPVSTSDEVPDTLAAVGVGRSETGERFVLGVAPEAGDAWLGAVAVAARLAEEEGFAGRVLVWSGGWSPAARRRMALLGAVPFRVEARVDARAEVEPEIPAEPAATSVAQVADQIGDPARRELFERAAAGLAGLAAKHAGAIQLGARQVSLVLLGQAVAAVRADAGAVAIETWISGRERRSLDSGGLSDALDRLEGSLRKHLSDRRVREGEMGRRASLAARLRELAGIRDARPWPLVGSGGSPLDFVGVDAEGRAMAGLAVPVLTLQALGPALDAHGALRPRLALLLAGARAPLALEPLGLLVGAERFEPAARRVLACLDLPLAAFDLSSGRPVVLGLSAPAPGRAREVAAPPIPTPTRAPRALREEGAILPATPAPVEAERPAVPEPRAPRRFEEVSLFDLAEATGDEGAGGARRGRRRRRGRGRSRGRGGEGAAAVRPDEDEGSDDEEPEREVEGIVEPAAEGRTGASPGRSRAHRPLMVEAAEEDDELDESLASLVEDVPDFAEVPEPAYEDEEEAEEDAEEAPLREEREARRRARIAKSQPEPEPQPAPRPVRRRAAIVAHADRDSIGASVLLARDLRLVEGFWIYEQADLMTFFRSVATDLREETPIYVVGFTASPARDTLQAAALYRDRLVWIDHHAWPPEDLEGLRAAISPEAVRVDEGPGSPLPLVLAACTRRSRFSDKLVDLLTGRFSVHDWERWGRVWWSRLGDLASRPGERRSALDPLLAGRPSDLAREASRAPAPPPPAEVEFAASRDFRLTHFGGYALVHVPVAAERDPNLSARIARERYGADLSLAWREGDERMMLAADDGTARRALDVQAMVQHLAEKFDWVDALADADHVARFRVAGLQANPERLEAVVAEIAMGRSILEG
jgi:hypothetical protein